MVKVKFTIEQALKAQRGSRGISLIFSLTSALNLGVWSTTRLIRITPGSNKLPMGLVGPQDRSGRVQKISSARAFDPRTIQPVAGSYNNQIPLLLLLLLLLLLQRKNCQCPRHDGVQGSGYIAPLILNIGNRSQCMTSFTLCPLYHWERNRESIKYEAG
jgi:hypothetical protein